MPDKKRPVMVELAVNGKKLEWISERIADIVELSFWGDMGWKRSEAATAAATGMIPPVNYYTGSEKKRRAQLCVKLVEELRHDLKWSWERIVDMLSTALRHKLDGSNWTPPTKSGWAIPDIV